MELNLNTWLVGLSVDVDGTEPCPDIFWMEKSITRITYLKPKKSVASFIPFTNYFLHVVPDNRMISAPTQVNFPAVRQKNFNPHLNIPGVSD